MVSIFLVAQKVSFKLSWGDCRQNLPSNETVFQELRKNSWHPQQVKMLASSSQAHDRSSSESASSSSGESSSSDEMVTVAWLQQSARSACHLVQGMAGTRFVPFCQDLPFDHRALMQ